jgi:hypothetical protein
MKKPKIIGLCGRMGSGKDAAAALLAMTGYKRIAFADPVRHEVAAAIGTVARPAEIGPKRWYHQFGIGDPVARAWEWARKHPEAIWEKPTKHHIRVLLQWWGTEYRRMQFQDYWVQIAFRDLDRREKHVFSDVRFPNEAQAIRAAGGVIWRIERDTESNGIAGHASESVVEEIQPDVWIDNSGTLLDLAGKLRAWI